MVKTRNKTTKSGLTGMNKSDLVILTNDLQEFLNHNSHLPLRQCKLSTNEDLLITAIFKRDEKYTCVQNSSRLAILLNPVRDSWSMSHYYPSQRDEDRRRFIEDKKLLQDTLGIDLSNIVYIPLSTLDSISDLTTTIFNLLWIDGVDSFISSHPLYIKSLQVASEKAKLRSKSDTFGPNEQTNIATEIVNFIVKELKEKVPIPSIPIGPFNVKLEITDSSIYDSIRQVNKLRPLLTYRVRKAHKELDWSGADLFKQVEVFCSYCLGEDWATKIRSIPNANIQRLMEVYLPVEGLGLLSEFITVRQVAEERAKNKENVSV
jgi:hypothetical protein